MSRGWLASQPETPGEIGGHGGGPAVNLPEHAPPTPLLRLENQISPFDPDPTFRISRHVHHFIHCQAPVSSRRQRLFRPLPHAIVASLCGCTVRLQAMARATGGARRWAAGGRRTAAAGSGRSEGAVRKGAWMAEEDAVLREHVRVHGPQYWSFLQSKGLLQRSGKSCRLRWLNKLRPGLKS